VLAWVGVTYDHVMDSSIVVCKTKTFNQIHIRPSLMNECSGHTKSDYGWEKGSLLVQWMMGGGVCWQ